MEKILITQEEEKKSLTKRKVNKGSQKYSKVSMQEELEDTVLMNEVAVARGVGFDFDKMMKLQERLARDQAIIKLNAQEIIESPSKKPQMTTKQLISSNGEGLFKKFDKGIWLVLIEFLDIKSAYQLTYISKYFNSNIPDFWKSFLWVNYYFEKPIETMTQIENYEKKLYLGRRYLKDFLQPMPEKRMLNISDLTERALQPELLRYTDALLDMAVIPSTSDNFSQSRQFRESNPPYLMLSLFPSEQKIILWKFRIAVLTDGGVSLRLFAGFKFANLDLHPRYAKFLSNDRFYVDFKEPCLRIYNLGKVSIYTTDPDETAESYEYEISFEDSKLIIRSPYFEEGQELIFDKISFPEETDAEWKIEVLEGDLILCLEKRSNILIIFDINNDQQCSCKVLLLECNFQDTPFSITDIWVPPQAKNEIRKIFLVDKMFNVYLVKMQTKWKKSNECEKIQLEIVFDSSKYPEMRQNSYISKRIEFFSWIKEKENWSKSNKNVDACIMFTYKRFYLIDLETGDVKEFGLANSVTVKGWTVFNNLLLYALNALHYISLYIDCSFWRHEDGPNLALLSAPHNEYYFLKFDGFIAVATTYPSNATQLRMVFFHNFQFRIEPIIEKQNADSKFGAIFSDGYHLGKLFEAAYSKEKRTKFEIEPTDPYDFEIKTIKNAENFSLNTQMIIEAKNSVVFLRGYKSVGFVDILSRYKKFEKIVAFHTFPLNMSNPKATALEVDQLKKQKLVNYQELIPNPNTAEKDEKVIGKTQNELTKTAIKKVLKGLSKSQRLEKLKELGGGKDIRLSSEEEAESDGSVDSSKTKGKEGSNSNMKGLEKKSKFQEAHERCERERIKDKNIKSKTYEKYFNNR